MLPSNQRFNLTHEPISTGLPWVWEFPFPFPSHSHKIWGSIWGYPYGDIYMGIHMWISKWGSTCGSPWGFPQKSCGNGMGMGMEIPFPRQPCISNINIVPASPLHAYTCIFRWFNLLIYHLNVGTLKWSPSSASIKSSMIFVITLVQEKTGLRIDQPDPRGGTTSTGSVARRAFSEEVVL